MDRAKFLELQFQTLRKEIEETKSRMFTLELGVIGVPLIPAVVQILRPSDTTKVNPIWENLSGLFISVTPFFIVILMSAFIAQRTALMRCGTYIRCHIEPLIDGITGWETWLETRPRRRRSDQFGFYSFLLICLAYYALMSWLAVNDIAPDDRRLLWLSAELAKWYPPERGAREVAAYLYGALGLFLFVLLWSVLPSSTHGPAGGSLPPGGRPQHDEPCEGANPVGAAMNAQSWHAQSSGMLLM